MGLQTGEVRVIQLMDLMEESSNHTEANQNTTACNTYFQRAWFRKLSYRINFPHPVSLFYNKSIVLRGRLPVCSAEDNTQLEM